MANDERLEQLLKEIIRLSDEVNNCQNEIRDIRNKIESSIEKNSAEDRTANGSIRTSVTSKSLENFIGLKLIHFVGIIVLLIGLTIGVKYAIDVNLISPLIRIILTYIVSAVLLLLSFRLRKQFLAFTIILFSGAMASAYFTTYAAYEYYHIMNQPVAFIIMLLLTIYTVYAALLYNRAEIANLGLVGAYAIPFFVGGNSENLLALYSYILLINGAILYISYKRYWLSLIYLAFFCTWIIYLFTSVIKGTVKDFTISNIFAFVYFILFLITALVFKIGKKQQLNSTDTFIILLNSLFLYIAVNHLYTASSSAEMINLVFAVVYMLAALAAKKILLNQVYLTNALFAVSLTTAVVYIAQAFTGINVTIGWVLLAIISFIAGLSIRIKVFRIAAIFIFALTLIKLLFVDSAHFSSIEKIIAYLFTGTVILIVSFLYQKFGKLIFDNEKQVEE